MEKELSTMQYNKRTQHHYGLVRAKIAQLKEKQEKRSKGGGKSDGYEVKRSGDATVILLGFPSTGKSTLLNALTDAQSEVGSYSFTTLTVVPGMLKYKHARIQILDVPGIVKGAASGKGRGKEVLASMRSADMAFIVVDATRPDDLPVIRREVYETRIRLDQRSPDVRIRKKAKDGIRVGRTVATPLLDNKTVTTILKEFRINNADITIRSPIDADQFIDCIEGNRKYMHSIVILNKIDLVDEKTLAKLKREIKPDICISAKNEKNFEGIKELIFDRLEMIRIYLKEPRKDADTKVPLIMFRNCTTRDVCRKLHRDFEKKFKFSRVWGPSAKFPGQRLMLNHKLKDTDILELHMI
ncbi:GTP-binding protein [Candidatus Woesearchaeota archaeon]|nr:GTP-binding protein [Candidatus Woesearchaeota archaeon]